VIDWIQSARTLDKWLILMFHQIDEEGRAWSARPEMLAEVVKYLRENDVHTMTVREGLKALQNVEFGGH